jgi:DNA modification methylase
MTGSEQGSFEFDVNKLILGDNLEILKGFSDETVDLIYLDPSFFSNRNYEVIWGDAGKSAVFKTGGLAALATILNG